MSPGGGPDARTPTPETASALQDLAQAFLILEHACSFYPEGHQGRRVPLERLLERLLAAGGGTGALGVAGAAVLWRGAIDPDPGPVVRRFAALLAGQGIARLTWTDALTAAELQDFVGRLARGRGAAQQRRAWDGTVRYEHLDVEVTDYQALMAESGAEEGGARRQDLWRALLQRTFAGGAAEPTAEELELLHGEWGPPEETAALLVEAAGAEARTGAPAAAAPVRRLASLVERAAAGDGGLSPEEGVARLAAVGARLPPALRLRLLEAAMDAGGGDDLFARAFGALPPAAGAELVGENLTADPARIERLTRVFRHLVPRQIERMELAPRVRDAARRAGAPDEPLPENAWEEVQELLTGEAGECLSPSYRAQLQRLAEREARWREEESALAAVPGIEEGLSAALISRASLAIQLERLRLASSLERFRDALEGLAGLAGAALAAGDHERGTFILTRLLRLRAGDEPLAGPAVDIERAVRAIGVGPMLAALAGVARPLAAAEMEVARQLAALDPQAAAPVLLDALLADEGSARRPGLEALTRELGPVAAAEALRRIEAATPAQVRLLLGPAASDGATAGPVLLRLLGRDDPRLRREVLRALLGIDSPEVRRALPRLLEDRDEEIAQTVAAHLGATGSPEIVRELLRQCSGVPLLGGRRAARMRRAILLLGRMRAAEAVPGLSALLLRRPWVNRKAREELGESAARALALIGGPAARGALEEAARGSGRAAAASRELLSRWGA